MTPVETEPPSSIGVIIPVMPINRSSIVPGRSRIANHVRYAGDPLKGSRMIAPWSKKIRAIVPGVTLNKSSVNPSSNVF